MAQKRWFDPGVKGTGAAAVFNTRLLGLIAPGVYEGFTVGSKGTIAAGVLLTPSGVKVEETGSRIPAYGDEWKHDGIPQNTDTEKSRKDLIVCHYEYETSQPVPVASFRVIEGLAAADPAYPDLPENCILLAKATIAPNGSEYSSVIQAGPAERLYNCTRNNDFTYTILNGDQAAIRIVHDINSGAASYSIQKPGTVASGGEFSFAAPVCTIGVDGIVELNDLAGVDRTTETVKGNADNIATTAGTLAQHIIDTSGGYSAGDITVLDSGENFDSGNVEGVLEELAEKKISKTGGTMTGTLNTKDVNLQSGYRIYATDPETVWIGIAPCAMRSEYATLELHSSYFKFTGSGTLQAPVNFKTLPSATLPDKVKSFSVRLLNNDATTYTPTFIIIKTNMTTGGTSSLSFPVLFDPDIEAGEEKTFSLNLTSEDTISGLYAYTVKIYLSSAPTDLRVLGAGVKLSRQTVQEG